MKPCALTRRRSFAAALLVMAGMLFAAAVACGGNDELTGTWLRTDDHDFVLTISKGGVGEGYEIRFENTGNGESQTITGVSRPGDTLQAALEIPQEPVGALAAGAPEVVPITLKVGDDGELIVTMDGAGGEAPVELWRYERDD